MTLLTDANLLSRDLWRRCGFERSEDSWVAPIEGIAEVPTHIEIYAEPTSEITAAAASSSLPQPVR